MNAFLFIKRKKTLPELTKGVLAESVIQQQLKPTQITKPEPKVLETLVTSPQKSTVPTPPKAITQQIIQQNPEQYNAKALRTTELQPENQENNQ